MRTTVTICKGGTGEREVDLQSHSVPDAWHAMERLRRLQSDYFPMATTDANLIHELWLLAHAMRDHILENAGDPADQYIQSWLSPNVHLGERRPEVEASDVKISAAGIDTKDPTDPRRCDHKRSV